jgi:plasmid maintenance system killer protein
VLIYFDNSKFEQDCNNQRALLKRYGKRMAEIIRRRLDDLDAANNLEEMRHLPGRCHELHGNLAGHLSIDLIHPQRLLFPPADTPIPKKTDGGLDWTQIESIKIIGIKDTHD